MFSNEEGVTGGTLLVAKICDALVKAGYGDDDIKKVGGLVLRNVMTSASGDHDLFKSSLDELRKDVDLSLEEVLDKNTRRSHNVNFNSNEPVLVINAFAGLDRAAWNCLVDHTVMQLQQTWGIWPVRVYAGPFVATEAEFEITLLNVVNTDIGGPSMVQLLDTPCDAPEWQKFVRREAWRERDLLYRQDGVLPVEVDTHSDDGSEHSVQSDDSESTDAELAGDDIAEEPAHEDEAAFIQDVEEPHSQHEQVPTSDEPEPEEIPIPSPEPHELDLPEKRSDHSTWERPQNTVSLLNLPRSRSSRIVPLSTEEGHATDKHRQPGEEDAESASEVRDAVSDKDADFVVV
ncbi:dihydroxyacetone kinase [Exophiala viscosa]|uniref:Dihydroxyacetone kinase n=1 Tax=Exophiala viscosa TaxID=2486360 RepID=A0AAN6E021_9EURO|nr:dihydroxyacetone kinase [Exophiala viscosa]KAI1621727.1 dihydroxyacetone kinase [Exophiala viscosa]